jgi:type IV fimbrial biogenesis protein FimT
MRRDRGFTIIELLITMAIVSIVLMVAVPQMTQFMADRAAEANAQEFAQAVRFARSEAMKRARPVSLCATDKPEDAEPVCSEDSVWDKGWLVVYPESGQVLRVQNALRAMRSADPVDAAAAQIDFQSTGIATAGAGDYDFYPTGDEDGDTYKTRIRRVNVNVQGRVNIVKGIE